MTDTRGSVVATVQLAVLALAMLATIGAAYHAGTTGDGRPALISGSVLITLLLVFERYGTLGDNVTSEKTVSE